MIINLIAVDPENPERILQYRIPERSRELEILQKALDIISVEYTILTGVPRKPRKDSPR